MGESSKSAFNAGNLAAKIRARQAATVAHPVPENVDGIPVVSISDKVIDERLDI